MRILKLCVLVLGLAVLGSSGAAHAQDHQSMRLAQLKAERTGRVNQLRYLDQLQRDYDVKLNRAIDSGIGIGTAAAGYTSAVRHSFEIKARIEAIDREITALRWRR